MKTWAKRILLGLIAAVGGLALILTGLFLTGPKLSDARLDQITSHLSSEQYGAAAEMAESSFRSVAASLELPSISVAAAVDGEVVWSAAIGYADLKNQVPATAAHRYRTGSVAKSLTSIVLARLVDQGAVRFDDAVGPWVPEVHERLEGATLRQLAGHMGGVRHYSNDPEAMLKEQAGQTHYERAQDALELFVTEPPLFDPGQGFSYSTHGYTLLAAALERATESDYLTLLEELVTSPLGLSGTGADDVRTPLENRVVGYIEVGGRFFDPPDANPSYKWAGGGLLSTAPDLAQIAGALMGGELVPEALTEELWTPQLMSDGTPNPQNYGMGWRMQAPTAEDGPGTMHLVHHGGASPGGSSFLVMVPEEQVAIAVLTNRSLGDAGLLRSEALQMAFAFVEARTQAQAGTSASGGY